MRRTAGFAAAVAVAALTGCGWFDDPSPDTASIFLEGEPGARVTVITSVLFVAGVDERQVTRVEVLAADSTVQTLPFTASYDIREHHRFFVQVVPAEEALSSFRMQVMVDDREVYDESGPLAEEEPFRFVYSFNQRLTRFIDVTL